MIIAKNLGPSDIQKALQLKTFCYHWKFECLIYIEKTISRKTICLKNKTYVEAFLGTCRLASWNDFSLVTNMWKTLVCNIPCARAYFNSAGALYLWPFAVDINFLEILETSTVGIGFQTNTKNHFRMKGRN